MICHETNIKIIRRHTSSIAIERDLEHSSKIKILFSGMLASAPQPPQNLSVTNVTATTAELEWDDQATPFDDYTVYVKNLDSGTVEQEITGIQLSEAEVMGLAEETEYEFWVTSVRDGIESKESNHVTTTTLSSAETRNINSLSFDGTDDYVEMNTINNNESVTLSALVKIDGSTGTLQAVAGQGYLMGGADAIGFGLYILSDLTVGFQTRNDSNSITALSTMSLETGQWYIITGVRDDSTDETRLYINGELVDTATGAISTISGTPVSFGIGQRQLGDSSWGFEVDGLVDEVQVWNKALTRTEIVENGNKILKGDESDLLGYWNCEDRNATLTDLTSNNNHGTINGPVYEYDGFDFDYALEFESANQDEVVATGYKGILGQQEFTLDVEFSTTVDNVPSDNEQRILGWGQDGTPGGKAHLRLNNSDFSGNATENAIRFEWDGGFWIGSTVLNDGEKHHVRVIKPQGDDGSGLIVLIDGELENPSMTNTGTVIDIQSDMDLVVGVADQGGKTQHFDGLIDKVALWTKTFTELESKRMLNQELSGDESDLELLYKFDDLTDLSVAVDSTGNGNDGAINGATYTTDALSYFQGLSFDGADDTVDIGGSSNLLADKDYFSISFLVKVDSIPSSAETLFSTFDSQATGENEGLEINHRTDGAFVAYHYHTFGEGADAVVTPVLPQGVWHRLTITKSASTLKMFVEGIEEDSVASNGAIIGGRDIGLGYRPFGNDRFFSGKFDELQIWDNALSASEQEDAATGLKGDESGLIGLWRMNEGVGSKIYDHAGTNHGTINGATFTEKVGVKV